MRPTRATAAPSSLRAGVTASAAALILVTGCGAGAEDAGPASSSAAPASSSAPPAASTPAAPSPSGSPTAPDGRGTPPAAMRISTIDIDSDVVPVTAEDRVLQIPPEPWVVGWWRDGVGVGSGGGTVVMTAHLDSREYGKGPFTRAKDLQPGAPMSLRDAAGVEHAYVVQSVDTYRKAVLPYAELFAQDGPERVVLVTCGGTYRREAGGWDSNVVVTFVPA
jgi:hypothetical protein